MIDRTRRFTVGLGRQNGGQHLRILAKDGKTKGWADRNEHRMGRVLGIMRAELADQVIGPEPEAWQALPTFNLATPKNLLLRFETLMRLTFKDETFDIQPEATT